MTAAQRGPRCEQEKDVLEAYECAGLTRLLQAIRAPGRYQGVEHLNVLTNCLDSPLYDRGEVCDALKRARQLTFENKSDFAPNFSRAGQGFSFGLNPYTDWALAQLDSAPNHAYLFLGIDWDTITSLGTSEEWFGFIHHPFQPGTKTVDRYWHNLWAWMMGREQKSAEGKRSWATVSEAEAAAFIRADGGAFIFHNLIPYLRPAGEKKSGTDWPYEQWKATAIRQNILEDLKLLQELAPAKRLFSFCTSAYVRDALIGVGYDADMVCCWSAHPSQVFHPGVIYREGGIDKRFRGTQHFEQRPEQRQDV
jgi:hypothetical protein